MEAESGAANVRAAAAGGGGGQESLENQDLSFLLTTVSSLFSEYGWYLLLLSGGVYLLIQHLNKKRSIQDRSSASTSSSDPVSVVRRQEALEASRQRMQAELDAKAAEFKEKQQRVNASLLIRIKKILRISSNPHYHCLSGKCANQESNCLIHSVASLKYDIQTFDFFL
uniref:Selenoprotein S n=1 Tax=Astyanax mexicanus TaxID=7994 RepID=A0A8B9RMZ6_ASTMX